MKKNNNLIFVISNKKKEYWPRTNAKTAFLHRTGEPTKVVSPYKIVPTILSTWRIEPKLPKKLWQVWIWEQRKRLKRLWLVFYQKEPNRMPYKILQGPQLKESCKIGFGNSWDRSKLKMKWNGQALLLFRKWPVQTELWAAQPHLPQS